jgi:hypothetical protein
MIADTLMMARAVHANSGRSWGKAFAIASAAEKARSAVAGAHLGREAARHSTHAAPKSVEAMRDHYLRQNGQRLRPAQRRRIQKKINRLKGHPSA